MKLIAILCWFDERSSWLAAFVGALSKHLQIDHLVAVDGAYGLVSEARGFSGFEQHEVLHESCRSAQIGLTLHAPQEPWIGNEIEKRNFAFQLAEQTAEMGRDWYLMLDADEIVIEALGARELLEQTECDLGQLMQLNPFYARTAAAEKVERSVEMPLACSPIQRFFRAAPGIHVSSNHYTYFDGEGRFLCRQGSDMIAAVDTRVTVEHRTELRDRRRLERQRTYYRRRDELGVEKEHEEYVAAA